ncbi:MAG: hypothetical protein IT548_13510 [Alphaproteobacteria bacterium]|nr:hypothetical protein [Alphaproteobacteria bacterium]
MTGWIRLRQLAIITGDLEAAVAPLLDVFGLSEGFRDPHLLPHFGLVNCVVPVGDQFIEICATAREGTQGERFLKRRGEGGYMVILQADPHAAFRARMDDLKIRVIAEQAKPAYHMVQLHPRDTGGPMLEVDWHEGGDTPERPWSHAVGHDWRKGIRTGRVQAIAGAEIQSEDPAGLAARWSEILGRPSRAGKDGAHHIAIDESELRFVPVTDGRGEGLGGIDIRSSQKGQVLAAARKRDLPVKGNTINLLGIRFNLV